jgi:hypothetical protein
MTLQVSMHDGMSDRVCSGCIQSGNGSAPAAVALGTSRRSIKLTPAMRPLLFASHCQMGWTGLLMDAVKVRLL